MMIFKNNCVIKKKFVILILRVRLNTVYFAKNEKQ